MTVRALCDLTASRTSLPAGGSISSMAGAYGAALAQMMCKLSLGREKYRQAESRLMQLDAELEALRLKLLEGISLDTRAYGGYLRAARLPRETEAQREARRAAMQEALRNACRVPLQNARHALSALTLAAEVVSLGNFNTLPDGLVGALLLNTAVQSAINNVRTNVRRIDDGAFRAEMLAACDALETQTVEMEQQARETAHLREET